MLNQIRSPSGIRPRVTLSETRYKWYMVPKWDASFVVLAMVASVEAIFLSTFVLISQNWMKSLLRATRVTSDK